MPFQRRILHHGADPGGAPLLLSTGAVRSCWFELHRQGGCGAGEVVLSDTFEQRDEIQIGDWISFEAEEGIRWYLGRVEERRSESPARVRLRLEGMGIELNEVFPGGFGSEADGSPPHRYAQTDLFPHDPDYSLETFDAAATADDVVRLLLAQYVAPQTHISHVSSSIETPILPAPVSSLKIRGEETARTLIKDLALRAQSASWGVDEAGAFFFLRRRSDVAITLREGRDLTQLAEYQDRELVFNRILLTGDYVYDPQDHSFDLARRSFRWRGNYYEPDSRSQYGDRRIRLWLPWVRTQTDSLTFAKEFFRTYSQPHSKYLLETIPQSLIPIPWLSRVRLEDRHGEELITARVETLRVQFDHAPLFRMELGPEDPRTLWPEPPHDERWELPDGPPFPGGPVEFTDFPPGGGSSDESGDSSTLEGTGDSSGASSDESEEDTGGSEDFTSSTGTTSGPITSQPEETSTTGGPTSGSLGSSFSDSNSSGESLSSGSSDSEGSSSGECTSSSSCSSNEEEESSAGGGGSEASSSSSGSSEETDPITFEW